MMNLLGRGEKGAGDDPGHVREQLSAYIDYELDEATRAVVRDHLRRCPVCENELATLKAAKQLLIELPPLAVPRSFMLTPDMVGLGQRGPVVRRSAASSLARQLRLATATVAMLLVAVLLTDSLLMQGGPKAGEPYAAESYYAQPVAPSDTPGMSQRLTSAQPVAAPTTAAIMSAPTAAPPAAGAVGAELPTEIPLSTPASVTSNVPSLPTTPGTAVGIIESNTGISDGSATDTTLPPDAMPPAASKVAPPAALDLNPLRLFEGGLLLLVLALAAGSVWALRRGV